VLAKHGIGPPPQIRQPRVIGVAVQADPGRGSRSARGGGVERIGDGLGQVLEPGNQVQIGAEPSPIEPGVDDADLAAQVRELRSQGGQALGQSAGRGFGGRSRGHGFLPSGSAYR
jgi:hypothetical protein